MIVNAFGKGGGSYLEPGDHLVHIFDVKDNERTAKPSVDITFKDDAGQTIKDTFWLTDESLWRIANLAIASGFASGPKDEVLRTLNPMNLQGRAVMIRVAKETSPKDGKEYSRVKSFWSPKTAKEPARQEPDNGNDPAYWNGKDDPF